jgi:anti-anti-sigma factor
MIEDRTLSIAVRDEGSERVIELFGELDAACVDTFREQVQAALADRPSTVIDLSGLDFIDSVGIEVIYRASEQSRVDGGGALRLIRGSANVQRTLTLMGLDQSLPFID